jgi:hypothetical protein
LSVNQLLDSPKNESLLAEECLVAGFTGPPSNPFWLEQEMVMKLLHQAEPVDDRPLSLKQMEVEKVLERLIELEEELQHIAQVRSQALVQSHRRVRALTKEGQIRVKPQLPMDILGIYVLQPGERSVKG